MTRVSVASDIPARPEIVFDAVTNIEQLPVINDDVVRVEFLSDQRSGAGTRFRETRRMGKREMDTDLEVTEYVPNERARMVTDSHGTIWDTVFTVRPTDGGAHLEIAMDARPHALMPRILNPLMKPLFRRGMKKYLDTLKHHCSRAEALR